MSDPNPYEPIDSSLESPPRGANPIKLSDIAMVTMFMGGFVWWVEGPMFGVAFGSLAAVLIWLFGHARRKRE